MCVCSNGIWRNEVVNIPPKMARGKYPSRAPQISPNEGNSPQSVCQIFLSRNVLLKISWFIFKHFWIGKVFPFWSCERLWWHNGQNPELDGWSTMQDLVLPHNATTAKLPQLSKHFRRHMLDLDFTGLFWDQICCLPIVSKFASLGVKHISNQLEVFAFVSIPGILKPKQWKKLMFLYLILNAWKLHKSSIRRLAVSLFQIVCDMFSEKWIHLGFPCQHQCLRGSSITRALFSPNTNASYAGKNCTFSLSKTSIFYFQR